MRRFLILIAVAATLWSCHNGKAKLQGRFSGYGGQKIYLEEVLPGLQVVVDSIVTDRSGNFEFKVTLPGGNATIYNIKYENDLIPVILSSGDKVTVNAIGNISQNYTVSGSEESELLHTLKNILSSGSAKLDGILAKYASGNDSERAEASREYTEQYYRAKREHIAFIVSHPGTLAALFGLYQRLPGEEYLFGGDNDIYYYRLVADSVDAHYPNSPYLKSLRRQVSNADSQMALENMIQGKITAGLDNYPEIEMPDIYGVKHKLSALHGDVILLDFWSESTAEGRLNNAEYKQIYADFAGSGFEIYQVCTGRDRSQWVSAVQTQQLPWISVCDFSGTAGIAVRAYNIQSIPANFIIDREGNIVARDIYGQRLRDTIAKLVK